MKVILIQPTTTGDSLGSGMGDLEPLAMGGVPGLRETSLDHILAFALTEFRGMWISVFIQMHLFVRKKRVPKAACVYE